MQKFLKKDAIKYGWVTLKKNFLFLVGLILISFVVSSIFNYIIGYLEETSKTSASLFTVVTVAVNVLIGMGILYLILRLHDNKKPSYKEIFEPAPLFIKYAVASVLYVSIVLVGLILLVVPGIIFGIKYSFYRYLIIDQKLGPIEALKKSGEITMGSKWNLFFLGILLGLINFIGALALGVGLLVTLPITMMASVYVYRKLLDGSSVEHPAEALSQEGSEVVQS